MFCKFRTPSISGMLALWIAFSISPAIAEKGGKKGGGGGDDSGDSVMPPVNYEVGIIPVAGLVGYFDTNDYGKSVCTIAVDYAPEGLQTSYSVTPAVVDLEGNVVYPEMLMNTTVDWDLRGGGWINNLGQLLCTGKRTLEDGSRPDSSLLLTPDGLGRYDVEVLLTPSSPYGFNDVGDIVVRPGSGYFLYFAFNGDVIDFSGDKILDSLSRRKMNNLGQFIAIQQAPPVPTLERNVRGEPDGSITPVKFLPEAEEAYASTNGFFESSILSDLNDFGITVGSQPVLEGKGKRAQVVLRPVVYDSELNPSLIDAPVGYDVKINNQSLNGESTMTGYTKQVEGEDDLWIKLPGFSGQYVVDLMDAANKAAWADVAFEDDNLTTTESVQLLTPYNSEGLVDHEAFPMMVGFAQADEWEVLSDGSIASGRGLFVLTPVPVQ